MAYTSHGICFLVTEKEIRWKGLDSDTGGTNRHGKGGSSGLKIYEVQNVYHNLHIVLLYLTLYNQFRIPTLLSHNQFKCSILLHTPALIPLFTTQFIFHVLEYLKMSIEIPRIHFPKSLANIFLAEPLKNHATFPYANC